MLIGVGQLPMALQHAHAEGVPMSRILNGKEVSVFAACRGEPAAGNRTVAHADGTRSFCYAFEAVPAAALVLLPPP